MSWWQPTPLDEAASRRHGRWLFDHSFLIFFAGLAVTLIGIIAEALSPVEAVGYFFAGLLVARRMLLDLRAASPLPQFRWMVWGTVLLAQVLLDPFKPPMPHFETYAMDLLFSMYRGLCWGITIFAVAPCLMFGLFREPFLRFLDADDEPAPASPAHPVDDRTAPLPPY